MLVVQLNRRRKKMGINTYKYNENHNGKLLWLHLLLWIFSRAALLWSLHVSPYLPVLMMMTWWHDDMMTWWPNDLMTWWPDDRKLRRQLTVWYIFHIVICETQGKVRGRVIWKQSLQILVDISSLIFSSSENITELHKKVNQRQTCINPTPALSRTWLFCAHYTGLLYYACGSFVTIKES